MKKIVILKHSEGELANQLWNYISIYAYGLESGVRVKNPSFFEYHPYFHFIESESILTKLFSLWFRSSIKRRTSFRNRVWRFVHKVYAKIMTTFHEKAIVSTENKTSQKIYLPPTKSIVVPDTKTLYFIGWLFRNPDGLEKYRQKLIHDFRPQENIHDKIDDIVRLLKKQNPGVEKMIGIHIRQGDYAQFKNGAYVISQERAREIVDEYIQKSNIDISKTLFIITSDGEIKPEIFSGLTVYISKENAVTDLFLLAQTQTIIGSDSSYGAFASWYGNTPHIIMTQAPIDWDYYTGKTHFFENKYCTLANY